METAANVDTQNHLTVRAEDIQFVPFVIPGFTGDTKAFPLNTDAERAPYIVLLEMAPGAHLRKHYHPTVREAVYVVKGELINDGERLSAGSIIAHGPGVAHGPHSTESGCTLMFIQSEQVTPDGSVFVD